MSSGMLVELQVEREEREIDSDCDGSEPSAAGLCAQRGSSCRSRPLTRSKGGERGRTLEDDDGEDGVETSVANKRSSEGGGRGFTQSR